MPPQFYCREGRRFANSNEVRTAKVLLALGVHSPKPSQVDAEACQEPSFQSLEVQAQVVNLACGRSAFTMLGL